MKRDNLGIRYLKPIFNVDDFNNSIEKENESNAHYRTAIAARAQDYTEVFLKSARPKEPINRPVDDFQL
jgi:hypothetical protein